MLDFLKPGSNDHDETHFSLASEEALSPDADEASPAESPKVYLPIQSENSLIIILGVLGVGLLVSIFANLFLLFNNRALAQRESIYVQQVNGETMAASEFDVTHREAAVIKNTAVQWMQLSFEWDNQIPGSKAEDQGYQLKDSTRTIPTEVYLASYLMEEGFRQEFLKLLAKQKIDPGVMQGEVKTAVRFFAVSDPRQVGEGTWQVDIVASRIERNRRQETAEVPMNRTITLKAIPPIDPVFEELEPSAWRQKLYQLLNNGLLITKVEPLEVD